MNWDAVAAIGQAVSALALIIVIVQVRHARQEVRRSASQQRAEALGELYLTRATNERLLATRMQAELALRGAGTSDFGSALMEVGITREQSAALFHEEMAWYNARWPGIAFSEDLTAGQRRENEVNLRGIYEGSGVSAIWYRSTKQFLNPEFVRYIDNLLVQPG